MKLLIFLIISFISSCGYPDIDSVPDFKNLTLSREEAIDLCKLANTDINNLSKCIDEINAQELK